MDKDRYEKPNNSTINLFDVNFGGNSGEEEHEVDPFDESPNPWR